MWLIIVELVVMRSHGQYVVVVAGTVVVVAKMPALHPGDVRKFEAVDVPGLDHMCDVIVFPQKVCFLFTAIPRRYTHPFAVWSLQR